jgi:hypothetical protein
VLLHLWPPTASMDDAVCECGMPVSAGPREREDSNTASPVRSTTTTVGFPPAFLSYRNVPWSLFGNLVIHLGMALVCY